MVTPNLSIFDFDSNSVRTVVREEDGAIAFCLSDLLRAMRSKTPPSRAKDLIEQGLGDGVIVVIPISDSLGRTQETLFVLEAGATFLLSRSRTEAGKRLNRKIHAEILPSIRKTGSYQISTESKATLDELEKLLHPSVTFKQLGESVDLHLKIRGKRYADAYLQQMMQKHFPQLAGHEPEKEERASLPAQALLTPTQIAAQMCLVNKKGNPDPRQVNILLVNAGLQVKTSGMWSATLRAINLGVCDRKPVSTNSRTQRDQLLWTESVIPLLREFQTSRTQATLF